MLSRKDQGCCSRGTATSIEDDVIHACLQGKVDVLFNVLGRHLHPDGDAARQFPNTISKPAEVVGGGQIGERRRRDGRLAFGQFADGGDSSR